ncbi:MAG: hypothetical protein K0R39_1739 [Symbiobacteriaceae bacterium]|jgi:uncharacterized cupredoxin-like copper-binding protein|nr:hypothetical protein [Symbiobacteriaceae bacterium]
MWKRWFVRTLCVGLLAASFVGGVGHEAAAAPRPRAIEVRAREYRFSPRVIQVKAGERVKVNLRNLGRERHEWELEKTHVEIRPVAPGKTGEVTFTAPSRPGTYEFACHVDGHYEKGMKGVLVVK